MWTGSWMRGYSRVRRYSPSLGATAPNSMKRRSMSIDTKFSFEIAAHEFRRHTSEVQVVSGAGVTPASVVATSALTQ